MTWTQIGHLIGDSSVTFWVEPLATPGEIENCQQCGEHARGGCLHWTEIEHMRAVHQLFHDSHIVVGFDGTKQP